MKPRKIDLAFEWMQGQPRRAYHYRDEVWAALAELHPGKFGVSDERKTPWFSLHRDMTQDRRFLRGDRGMFELANLATTDVSTPTENDPVSYAQEPQVWIFQSNPKYYRFLEALQSLDQMQFLVSRYKDRIRVGDTVLIWMSGKHAGIYAQTRIVEGVAERKDDDASFWVDPNAAATAKSRVVLSIERRFLANPVLKGTIAATEGLDRLLILRQPNGTNYPVQSDEWERLRHLLPSQETREPTPINDQQETIRSEEGDCSAYVSHSPDGTAADEPEKPKAVRRKDAILPVFNCPPATELKPIRPSSKVGQIVDMCAGDGARASDLMPLFVKRTGERWSRSSINGVFRWDLPHKGYGIRTIEDPAGMDHMYIVYAGTAVGPKSTVEGKKLSPLERNRRLLAHLASFGELTRDDLEDLGLDETHLGDWLDSLLVRRPEAYVVTPLFFHLIDGDVGPATFTTRLAARFMGEHLRRHASEPIAEIEEHVWSRFGGWHLPQPHGDDQKTRAYLSVPIREPHAVAASGRLDLFTHLPPKVIGDLIREPDFLAEQQSWSADAASNSQEGPLSTQLHRDWKRPLILTVVELRATDDGQVSIGEMERAEVVKRSYVVGGLPLAGAGEREPVTTLERSGAAELLLQHPVAAAILQFEVHRLFAELHGEPVAKLHAVDTTVQVEIDAVGRGPLWRHVRTVLEQVGYWPVGTSTQDSLWASAVRVTVKNLELLNVVERQGDFLRLTDAYESKIKAHPNHPLSRGEKPYRVRLSQFLAALQRGQA